MQKRDWLIAAALLFLGGLAFISRPSITGAFAIEPVNAALGTTLLILSIIFLVAAEGVQVAEEGLEKIVVESKIVSAVDFAKRFSDAEPDTQKRVIILDTSAILDYKIPEIEEFLNKNTNVYVPKSVLAEIKNQKLRQIVESKSKSLESIDTRAYERHKNEAREILEKTEKAEMYKIVIPLFDSYKTKTLSRRESAEISRRCRLLQSWAKADNIDTSGKNFDETIEKMRNYLERHCKVKDADVDVLATAIYWASHRQHALIGERDVDLHQAIRYIKKEEPDLGEFLDCIDTYRKAA